MPANNDPKINYFPNSILTFLMQSNCNSLFHSFSLSPFSSWFWLVRIFSFVISKTETHTITFWINIPHTKRALHSVKICRVYIRPHHSLISVFIVVKNLNFYLSRNSLLRPWLHIGRDWVMWIFPTLRGWEVKSFSSGVEALWIFCQK